ncbi:MAG TPA: RdgB/HAM1 family non-canonical purine NTP pyrophosphatase [Chryseosolibacter sp.]|nr:RdgB/HAM1 family non-canonical purine NTP pyrophosphatase [Chryseosolibacter sp.]
MLASLKLEQLTEHRIVAATNNQHKISEIRPLLEPDFRILSLEDIGCYDELPETESTLEGNSLQKAAFVHARFHLPCFADDTGLEVKALNGAPGVFSARYAGAQKNSADNIALLLKNLSGEANRQARFRTVITLIGLNGVQKFEGAVDGLILEEGRGTGGFGYDPVFQPVGYTKTMAEMTLDEKNTISHRALAIKKLVHYLNHHFHK